MASLQLALGDVVHALHSAVVHRRKLDALPPFARQMLVSPKLRGQLRLRHR